MTLRVLHCPELVGGQAWELARAERALGLRSWAVAFQPHRFGYRADEVLWAERDNLFARELKRWRLLVRAARDFDIVHFNFGRTIAPYWIPKHPYPPYPHSTPLRALYRLYAAVLEGMDLRLLKTAGKGIAVTFQGDDARQGDYCRRHFAVSPATEVAPAYYLPAADAHKRRRIAAFARYANRIYAVNPDLLHVLPPRAAFLPYAHIDLDEWRPPAPAAAAGPPVVVHAPSHRGVKGTRFILDAVARLRAEGIACTLDLVEDVSREHARPRYARADLVVDQLLVGWYGGLAVEAMALGRPVMCYLRPDDLRFVPEAMRSALPLIQADPHSVYEKLKEWLTVRRSALPEIGQRSRRYVATWHLPSAVAARLKTDYEAMLTSRSDRSPCVA